MTSIDVVKTSLSLVDLELEVSQTILFNEFLWYCIWNVLQDQKTSWRVQIELRKYKLLALEKLRAPKKFTKHNTLIAGVNLPENN